jgi:ribosome-interacting GTPase 1
MPNYSKGKIYKIVANTDEEYKPYVGSSCQTLCQRMAEHRCKYKNWKKGEKNYSSFDLFDKFGIENCKIILLEEYPCDSIIQLLQKEREWFEKIECCNKRIPIRSMEEKEQFAERMKIQYEANKEIISEKRKIQYKANKEIISEKQKIYRNQNKEIIAERMKIYRNQNKEIIAEKKKIQYEANKEIIAEKRKIQYEANKEIIAEKKKEIFTCFCGSIFVV